MYQTKQKDAILSFLKENKNKDFTSEFIMTYLKENNTPVGKTTLYRNLDQLVQSGDVKKYYDDLLMRYSYQYIDNQGDCSNHFHLKCSSCGRLIHLKCQMVDSFIEHVYLDHDFIIDKKTLLYGICHDCRRENSHA